MQEMEKLRKPREKHFKNEDGTFTIYAYDHDIHYLKNGKYIEKDNTLLEKTNTITNKANDLKIELAKRKTQKYLLKIEKQKEKIVLDIKEKEINKEIKKNQIIYKNILKNIDINYDVLDNGVKDTIILKEKENDFQKLIYTIKTDLEISKKENTIVLTKNKKTIYTIATPTLQDKEGNFYPISYDLKDKQFTFTIEKEILENEKLYPLTIDPTIEANEDNSIFDTYIYPGDENVNRNNQDILKVGVDQNNVVYRTLMKFNLPNIGTSSNVVNASVCLTSHKSNYYLPNEMEISFKKVNVHEINTSWNEETANWNTMHDKINARIEDYFDPQRSYIKDGNTIVLQKNTFNITNLVKKWYAGKENNGIMLKFGVESYIQSDKEYWFYSKNNHATTEDKIANPKPILMITYRNQNGLENYMTYQTIALNSSEIYTNNLTGNVTACFDINKTIGGKFPLQLNLFYNTNDIVLENTFNLSKGYKWNYLKTLKEVNFDNVCLEFLDNDGTLHYFRNQEGKIIDEDGLGLTATKEENKYILKDKDGNQMLFTLQNGLYFLTKIINTAKEEINIIYNTEGKITKLIDANKEEINIVYETDKIMVTSNYLTTKINLEKERITSLENKYGKTSISYNENQIINAITDTNGKKVNFSYYPVIPYRLQKIEEIGLENEKGTSLEFIYEFNVTRVKDNKGRTNSYTFNNLGNTTGITNLENNNLNNSYGISQEYFTNTEEQLNLKNKIKLETTPVKYTKNYLEDTSFEKGTYENATTEQARTGKHSLKINTIQEISIPQNLKEGNYTFSAYFKTDETAKWSVYQWNENQEETLLETSEILPNEEFTRFSIPISISSKTDNYKIKIETNNENKPLYMDDMQLEEGEVANYYNLVNNSDFSKEKSKWDESSYETREPGIISINNSGPTTLENGTTCYRLDSYPRRVCEVDQTIIINGKEKDTYYLSFWYKNEGTYSEDGYSSKNKIEFSFEKNAADHSIERKTSSFNLNPNENEWQLFQKSIIAKEEYDCINIKFSSNYDVNDLYITNVTLTKDIESTSYTYDDNGNLITTNNKNNGISEFKYDKNNQLTNLFEPKGNSFYFEYENAIPNQVRQGISEKGIANKIEYDENNNPIKTKIQNNDTTDLDGRSFYIRPKSSNQYIILNTDGLYASLKVPTCSKESWDFKKESVDLEDYSIKNSVIPMYLRYDGTLSKKEGGDIFHIIKNDNGSYSLRHSEGDLCLTAESNYFVATPYDKNNFNQQFYLEPIEEKEYIETSATYTSDGKFTKATTDALGKVTEYTINPTTGLTTSITDPNNVTTNYTYNTKDQITKVEKEEKETNYTYNEQDLLSKITCENKEYNFTYDNFLNTKEVKINNQVLVSNEYEENNGNLISSTYGNNSVVTYTYDELDRLKTLEKNNKIYRHIYDNQNHLAKIIEGNKNYNYYYDLADRLSKYEINNDLENQFTINYEYDLNNNVTKKIYTHKETKEQIEYTYDEDDSLIQVDFNNHNLNYIYDSLGRLKEKNINNQLPVTYEYERNGNKTSLILKRMTIDNIIYDYKYDNLYNITDIYKNKELINHYEYDTFSELIKEDNYLSNKTITYTYDNSGNILKREEYEINTDILIHEDNFAYTNTNWKDQLTQYNDTNITYDEIGNPITIGDKNLSWNARELQSYQDNMSKIEYFYNKEGIRTQKRVNNVETNYLLENSNIIMEETNGNTLYYMRTGENELIGFTYNQETYYYQKNYQGDIIGIYNKEYELIATYEYDSYGKVLSIKDANENLITDENHIAIINPFRYRSYYYDTETKLYYLNSRYYNPEWGRFLNVDDYIGTSETCIGYNPYIYCENNPIMNIDMYGNWASAALGGAIGTGLSSLLDTKPPISVIGGSTIAVEEHKKTTANNIKNPTSTQINKSENVNKLPTESEPNSKKEAPNGNIRVYGPNGKALKDIDYSHPGHHPELGNPHVHDWDWNKPEKDRRGLPRNPFPKELDSLLKKTAITAGGAYLVYRAVRMAISFAPGFWWTIPINAVTP